MLWKAHISGTWEGQVLCSWPLTSHLGLFFPLFVLWVPGQMEYVILLCSSGSSPRTILFPLKGKLHPYPSTSVKFIIKRHKNLETLAFALETEIHTSNNGTFLLKFFQTVYSDASLSLISSHILSTSLPTQFLVPSLSYRDLKQKTSKTDKQRQANKQESWSLFCVS